LFAQHPIPFEELWLRSLVFDVDGTGIRVCSLEDLIQLKKLAGAVKKKGSEPPPG